MEFEFFANIKIFRPSAKSEFAIRIDSENHLRKKYSAGIYNENKIVNEILKYKFSFYEKALEELIPKVASSDFLDFILFQFDSASEVEDLFKSRKLNHFEASRWKEIGQTFRRATKYIAERTVLLQPDMSPKAEKSELVNITEKIWICAESMVSLYMVSDQTYSIFPDETFIEIFPHGEKDILFQGLTRDLPDIASRVQLDLENRHHFIEKPSFLLDFEEHDKIIGETVKNELGITYKEALSVLAKTIEGCIPSPEGFPIPFNLKNKLVDELSEVLKMSKESVERALAGFTLSKAQMETESRDIWNSKQEYRAYRRAFFEMPHELGQHLTFSKAMAKECLLILIKDVAFKRFPKEWLNTSVEKSLGKLSNSVGKSFENIVAENITSLGFEGVKSAKSIGLDDKRITIPPEVGEIDYIGYSEKDKLLLLVECKVVRDSFEPKLFRDDLDDFVNSKKSYTKKFAKKANWVRDNILLVSESLESKKNLKTKVEPENFAKIIITFFPAMVSYFIEDFPCISLTEFMLDYRALGRYPYEVGFDRILK
jgi:hypothetical protein